MSRHKTVLRVLSAVALVAVLAVLPILSARWQDRVTLGKSALGQMQDVQLNFQDRISGLGLLALMDHGRNWTLDASAASMTQEDAEHAARKVLETYQDAGFIDRALSFDVHLSEVRTVSLPYGLAGVVWNVILVAQEGNTHFAELDLSLDDATGRVMSVNYGSNDLLPEQARQELLLDFADLFFRQLEIEEYTQAAVDDLDNTYIGDNGACAQRYRFGDSEYGEINVDLYVFQQGFYVSYYESGFYED